MLYKRGQLTIFIIIALIIVSSAGIFFAFKNRVFYEDIPPSISPFYNNFLGCLKDSSLEGIKILGSRGGYIYLPDFEPGSAYSPFSSQLDFFGNPIPYWYYVSGSNLQKEQVPSKSGMERDLSRFVGDRAVNCLSGSFSEQELEVVRGEPSARVTITDNRVNIELDMEITVKKGEDSFFMKEHKLSVDSSLGRLYNSARRVYDEEIENLFLESYGVDILRIYAPVDGVAISCAPKIWDSNEIFENLKQAIEENTLSLKKDINKNYFSIDLPVSEKVRFLNFKEWPGSFEVNPSENNMLIARPVGNQPGLGVLGFCYVPYHFVYNLKYPVLVQVYSEKEIFQFPFAVVIEGNKPRKALEVDAGDFSTPELCRHKNMNLSVSVYDSNLKPIDAEISYECFGERCGIGKTSSGTLTAEFPQCANGFIVVISDGFEKGKYMLSSVKQGSFEVVLDRIYEVDVELKVDGARYDGDAIITISSDKSSETILYPDKREAGLSDGEYDVSVYIYKNSSLKLGKAVGQQCIDVASGLKGLIGITEKKCFDVEIPSQVVSSVLAGGGTIKYYVLESELKNSKVLEINVDSLPVPDSVEQLQQNYILLDSKEVDIKLR